MFTFYRLVKELAKYGKKAVSYAWDHKGTLLKLIEQNTSIGRLIKYVIDRI